LIADLGAVPQFHHIVKVLLRPADLENVHQSLVCAGDRLEALDALELALERLAVLEHIAPDDFNRAQSSQAIPRQPDLAVATAANQPEQFMIGDWRWRRACRRWDTKRGRGAVRFGTRLRAWGHPVSHERYSYTAATR
jgi:hypothetical protein